MPRMEVQRLPWVHGPACREQNGFHPDWSLLCSDQHTQLSGVIQNLHFFRIEVAVGQ